MGTIQDLQSALLDATKLLSDKSINEAKYAYTIKCTIIGIENASLNLYTVEYGANTFNAYGGAGVSYKINDIVYVLIPDGDFNQEKQIIGAVAPKASMYVPEQESDVYVSTTNNLLGDLGQINLKSWIDSNSIINLPNISQFNSVFAGYLEDNRHFKFSAKIKTEIDKDHQVKGNYGLILNLPFTQKSLAGTGASAVWRSFPIDVTTIEGNPYAFDSWNMVDLYFDIDDDLVYDTQGGTRAPYISAFVEGFGYAEPRVDIDYDIHFKDIGIEMVDVLTENDMNGYSLTISSSEGFYFLNNGYENAKVLTPILKVKGKTETNLSKWECYWFVEDSSIGINNENYLSLGGLGWRCLNKKTKNGYDASGHPIYQYVKNNYNLTVTKEEVSSTLKFKCVMVQDTVVVGGSAKLKNLDADIEVALVSATNSSTFVAEIGYVDLIARIHYPNVTVLNPDSAIDLGIFWQRFDKSDNFLDDSSDDYIITGTGTSSKKIYEILRYNDPVTINGKVYWETEFRYPCANVDQMNTIKCSFFSTSVNNDGEIIRTNLGSDSLVINTSKNFTYGLTILGGDVLYKYDADGDSPFEANYDGPLSSRINTIKPINYKIYKADGRELTETEYLYCSYTWSFPKNSMMKLEGFLLSDLPQDDNYYYVKGNGLSSINYKISSTYNKKKSDNTILLNVDFAGTVLSSSVSPKFLKDGEGGTNGTKYSAIITHGGFGYGEKNNNGVEQKCQFVYVNSTSGGVAAGWYYYNRNTQTLAAFGTPSFGVKVYADGELVSASGKYTVTWSMFDSGSTTNINNPCFTINSSGTLAVSKIWNSNIDNTIYTNIIQATIKMTDGSLTSSNETIYAYYPIEITWIPTGNIKKIPSLEGGYEEVLYASDGTNPSYDNSNPFECNDSLYNDTTSNYAYVWVTSSNLTIASAGTYQKKITPKSKYDSGMSRNYVKVNLTMNDSQRQIINNKINQLENIKTSTINKQNFYATNKVNILEFVKEFSYNNSINLLNEAKLYLSYRGQGLQTIEELYELLNNIIALYKKKVNTIGNKTVDDYFSSYKDALDRAKNNLYLTISSKDISDIIELNLLLTISDNMKNYGMSYYNNLKTAIDSWNDVINKYNKICAELKKKNSSNEYYYKESVNKLHTFTSDLRGLLNSSYLNVLVTKHDNIDPLKEFINLKSQLTVVINKLIDVDGKLTSYDDIVNYVLDIINNNLRIYNNTVYQNKYYKEINDTLTLEISEYKKQIDGYRAALLPANSTKVIHIKPIVMIYNRYEMSALNGWDGNKLYVDKNNNEYLLAPQIGAGTKSNNLFTGLVMGVKQFNNPGSNKQLIGLFGYSAGIQSLFLNAEDGSAIFGKSGKGQITLDPTSNKALLYSSNFWKNYKNDGKPSNYTTSNYNNEGMLIDLTTPEIRFGSGNFIVNSNGHITAKGGGTIAGWNIGDTTLISNNNAITLDSANSAINLSNASTGKIYSGSHNALNTTTKGFYLSNDGLSIHNGFKITIDEKSNTYLEVGKLNSVRHWTISGDSTGNSYIAYGTRGNSNSVRIATNEITLGSRFYVDAQNGSMRLGKNAVSADSSSKYWTIDTNNVDSYIAYGTTEAQIMTTKDQKVIISDSAKNGEVYFGTSAIRLGTKFAVDKDGNMLAKYITASGGTIGGWNIATNGLYSDHIMIQPDSGIYHYAKDDEGNIYNNWAIKPDGSAIFKNITAVDEGTIGGWTIEGGKLSGSDITLNGDDGSITGSGFALTSTGIKLENPFGASSLNWGSGFGVSETGILTAAGANISGAITATGGKIGDCEIKDGKLSVPAANISGKLTASQIKTDELTIGADKVTGATAAVCLTGYSTKFASVMAADGSTVNVLKEISFNTETLKVLAVQSD